MSHHRPAAFHRAIGKRNNVASATCRKMLAQGSKPDGEVKVRLDKKTVVTLKSIASLPYWTARFPNAEVIN